jgi:RNA polymerase sigma factor (sigma-70 family)
MGPDIRLNPSFEQAGQLISPSDIDPPARGTRLAVPVLADTKNAEQTHFVALLERMAKGEEAALGALYDSTVGRVYGFALRIVNNPSAAEEIASDVFLQVWKDAGRYESSRAKVVTWLLMICRSRALDWLRGRSPEILHDAPETLAEEQPVESAPPDLLQSVQENDALHAAIAKLTPVQRQLVGLAFFRGLSHQEIAEHSQLPLGTVKSHLRRALESLRAVLSDA